MARQAVFSCFLSHMIEKGGRLCHIYELVDCEIHELHVCVDDDCDLFK